MVNLCGELVCASLPRPQHEVVAPNLGDDSGKHEDHGTTESTEITERRTRRNPKEGTMMEEDQINRITERIIGAAIHEAQILSYLKLSGCPVGLQINFNVRQLTEGIKRFRIGMDVCRGPARNSLRDLCVLCG
jgi:hypothetical protein